MDILIFGGQSNMQGQTEGLPENNAPVQGALEYRVKTDELIPLQHPVGEDDDFIMLTDICVKMSMQKEYINPKASGHYNNAGMEIVGKNAGEALALNSICC